MIVTQYGIVATSQFLASQAGAKMLEAGGNAIDAAIAANAVLGLTQPYVNGMGGDLFAIVYEAKTGKVYGLNSSGWTPKALTIDYLKSKGIDKIDRAERQHHHGAGLRGGLGRAAAALRHQAVRGAAGAGDLLRGERIPAAGDRGARLDHAGAAQTAGLPGDVHAGRRAAAAGRRVQESGAGRIAAAGCGEGPRRLLQGEDRRDRW